MLLYTRRASRKPPHQRSRHGCLYCKLKRKKCDEIRPKCSRCMEKGEDCKYEEVRPREFTRISVNWSSAGRDSESPASSDSQWDFPNDDWCDFSSHNYSSASVAVLTEDSDFSAGQISDLVDSPIISTQECSIPEHSLDMTLNYPVLDFDSLVIMEFAEHEHRRVLVDHFCNVLTHLLVFREDTGNPFRQMIPPFSDRRSPVLDVVLAFSSSHLEHKGIRSEENSIYFHNKALQGLGKLIDDFEESNKEEILSTIMLLVYYEVLVRQSDANIINDHLKAAMATVGALPQPPRAENSFIKRSLYYYDVIVALSLDQSPIYTPLPEETQPSRFNGLEPLNSSLGNVDTLLGLFADLWPIMHRLSTLRSSKFALEAAIAIGNSSEASVLRAEFDSTARGIELALRAWKPAVHPHSSADEWTLDDSRLQSVANNAEAYRYSALAYLYRDVYLYPQSSPLVQKWTHLSLIACSNVVEFARNGYGGPLCALLWPLFTAACNATDKADRELATAAFTAIDRTQGMKNIVDAWDVVGEVWRRLDLAEWDEVGEIHWQDICQERGLNIVFG